MVYPLLILLLLQKVSGLRLTDNELGIVGLMRALKQETAKLSISISVIAPGITLTPILKTNREGSLTSMDAWAKDMRSRGVPINSAETIGLAVAYLMNGGMQSNGKGLLIQDDKVGELESGIAKTRKDWMGEEMLGLFRGGRGAPLFERIDPNAGKEKSKI
jgi:hypothetical protein